MPEFDINGYSISSGLSPDEMDVRLTPEDLKKWRSHDEVAAFIFMGWFYSMRISREDYQKLESGEVVIVKAYKQPSL